MSFLIRRSLFVGVVANLFLESAHLIICNADKVGTLHWVSQFFRRGITCTVKMARAATGNCSADSLPTVARYFVMGGLASIKNCCAGGVHFRCVSRSLCLASSSAHCPVRKCRKRIIARWPNLHDLRCRYILRDRDGGLLASDGRRSHRYVNRRATEVKFCRSLITFNVVSKVGKQFLECLSEPRCIIRRMQMRLVI